MVHFSIISGAEKNISKNKYTVLSLILMGLLFMDLTISTDLRMHNFVGNSLTNTNFCHIFFT